MFCCNPFKGRRQREEWGDTWRVKMVVVGDSQCGKTNLIQRYCCGTLPHTYTPTLFDTCTTSCLVDGRKVQMIIQDTAGQEDLDRSRPPFYLHTDVIIVCFDADDNPDSWDRVRKVWVSEIRRYCGKHVPLVLVATKMDLATPKSSVQASPALCDANSANSLDDKEKRSSVRDSSIFESSDHLVPCGVDEERRSLLAQSPFKGNKTNHAFSNRQSTLSDRYQSLLKVDTLRPTFIDAKSPQSGRQHYGSTERRGDSLATQTGAVRYIETSAVLNQGVQQVFSTALTAAMASKKWRRKYRV